MVLITFNDIRREYASLSRESASLRKYSYIFPIEASESLAGVIADLLGDGHLQKKSAWRFDYTSKDKKELLRFENELYKLFKIKGKIRKCYGNKWKTSYNYGVNNSVLARAIYLCGVPFGAKVAKKFRVPKWIMQNKNYFRFFVRRLFACEGYVWHGPSPGIGINMWKKTYLKNNGATFFNDIKSGLWKFFSIKTTKVFTYKARSNNKDGDTIPLKFYIKRKESIRKFYDHIGFGSKEKQFKLRLLVQSWGRSSNG